MNSPREALSRNKNNNQVPKLMHLYISVFLSHYVTITLCERESSFLKKTDAMHEVLPL